MRQKKTCLDALMFAFIVIISHGTTVNGKIVQRVIVERVVRKNAQKINNPIKSRICYENGYFH